MEALLRLALTAAGYHRHARGHWRKRREGRDMAARDSAANNNGSDSDGSEAARREQAIRAAAVPETYAERHAIISRAANGDPKAEAQAIAILRKHPGEFQIDQGNPKRATLALTAGSSSVAQEIVGNEYRQKLREVAGPSPSPLETLLAERIVVCRMQLAHFEKSYADKLKEGLSLAHSEHDQRRLERLERRLVSAIKALVQVRRLGLPAVQVNIGERQVNISGSAGNVPGGTLPPVG